MAYCDIKAYSRKGIQRKHNEDACGISQSFLLGNKADNLEQKITKTMLPIIVTLADGMGGHDSGDVASQTTVRYLSELFDKKREEFKIDTAINSVHRRIQGLDRKTRVHRAMGTTLVGAILFEDMCHIFNVGDSRAYLLRNGSIKLLSTDDVYPGQQNSPITQCIGGGNPSNPRPHIKKEETHSGDQLIFVSDGITDVINDDNLCHMLLDQDTNNGKKICDEANALKSGDDTSIVICLFN